MTGVRRLFIYMCSHSEPQRTCRSVERDKELKELGLPRYFFIGIFVVPNL